MADLRRDYHVPIEISPVSGIARELGKVGFLILTFPRANSNLRRLLALGPLTMLPIADILMLWGIAHVQKTVKNRQKTSPPSSLVS